MNREYGRSRRKESFGSYIRRTYKNKLCAAALLICGLFSTYVMKEASALLYMSIISIPLFFSKENWIVD